MPSRKKAKAKGAKVVQPKTPKHPKTVPEPFTPGDRKMVLDTFDQTLTLVKRVTDPARRDELSKRVKAMRAKFAKLPRSKITTDRAAKYMEEVTKLAQDVANSKGLDNRPRSFVEA